MRRRGQREVVSWAKGVDSDRQALEVLSRGVPLKEGLQDRADGSRIP